MKLGSRQDVAVKEPSGPRQGLGSLGLSWPQLENEGLERPPGSPWTFFGNVALDCCGVLGHVTVISDPC